MDVLVIYEPKTLTGDGIGTFRGHCCVMTARAVSTGVAPIGSPTGVRGWWLRRSAARCLCSVLDVSTYDSPVPLDDIPFHEMEPLKMQLRKRRRTR